MKKFLFITILAALISALLSKTNTHTLRKKAILKEHAEDMMAPNDHMMLIRSYPDKELDVKAYQDALLRAHSSVDLQRKEMATFSWTVEGPGNIGGRFNCTAVNPLNSNIIYAGAATGGIFKTTNGGTTWNPIFDSQPFISIGCITIDPNNPSTIWAGTGDANISGLCYIGDGIYKSVDGGNTWTNMGLNNQHVFSKIIVDPSNSNTVYAATMGQPFVRDNNRGLFKSVNGGVSWTQIQAINNETGIIDLVINPTNPQILYSASYTRIRNNFESVYTGTECKIWKTTNGGTSWTQLTSGLPNYQVGRIGLAIYPANPNILYAVIADVSSNIDGIYKTTNGGTSWTTIPTGSLGSPYNGYGWYFGKVFVNPSNSNQIYITGVDSYTTTDNGITWNMATPEWWMYEVHGDSHDMQFINGNTIILCTDGGIYKTTDNCTSWTDIENIPVNQVYHANENPHITEEYWCGVQDNGTSFGNASTINSWTRSWGGDGFLALVDPVNSDVIYAESQYGGLVYSDDTGINFYDATNGIDFSDRINWDMPYLISEHSNTNLYAGTDKVYKMTGAPYGFWSAISADLTDGVDAFRDDLHTITTISESPLTPNKIMVGTGDANVWLTTNDGGVWTNITGTLPVRYVTCVKISPNVSNNLYVTHSGYRDGDNAPHIHKSINNGSTWAAIAGDLPQVGINDVLVTTGNENIIYIATDIGVYYTINGGVNWVRLGNNMPMMPVFDLEFNTTKDKVIAATFARSVQTVDISTITGIAKHSAENELGIFPNPASDFITIHSSEISGQLSYEIFDLNGKKVKYSDTYFSGVTKISIADLSRGTYVLSVVNGNKKTIKKFVKI
jgi:photosystem II stability/assembly factor-like uncharacterized protein